MNNENTSTRLKQIMKERNLRQVDLLEMVKPFCKKYNVKINKSDISQYLSGKVKPGQEKLSMLGMALNINETWLMGYDVPKEKTFTTKKITLSKEENILLDTFNTLDVDDKNKVIDYSKLLSSQDKYKKDETIEVVNPSNDELCATKVVELPTNKKFMWEETGKEHLMPIASHDDGLTDEERAIVNARINEILKNLDKY